jgi:hypothetical protein
MPTLLLTTLLISSFSPCTNAKITGTLLSNSTTITLEAISDSYVSSSDPDSNYGSLTTIKTEITAGTEKNYTYTYLMFDLSSIPSNTLINSANLSLYMTGISGQVPLTTGGRIYTYYSSDTSWSETGITWNNKPSFNSEATGYKAFFGTVIVNVYYKWNVTSDVSQALSAGKLTEIVCWANYTSEEFYGNATFQSKEAANKPKLTVEYSYEMPPASCPYLVVRGSNNIIYYRQYDCVGDTWGGWTALPGSTGDTPAATVCENELHIVVRGMGGASLYHGYVDLLTDDFSGWSWMSGSTPSIPRLASDENSLYLIVRGDDNRIYHRRYDLVSESWGEWNAVPTGSTMDAPGVCVDDDYLHIIVRGMDDSIYHQEVYLPTLDYLGWSNIGGSTPSIPALTSNYKESGDDHEVYLVVRGSDNGIYLRSYDGSWSSWTKLPGSTNDAFGACIQPSLPDADACLHIVVRGMDGAMYHGKYDLNSEIFLGWSWMSGTTPSPPVLTS